MNFVIAVFVGIWFWFAGGAPGYTFHYVLKQPLVMALPIGLLMGDVPQAMMIGAAIELVYVGSSPREQMFRRMNVWRV